MFISLTARKDGLISRQGQFADQASMRKTWHGPWLTRTTGA
jgi:hypothetical protein